MMSLNYAQKTLVKMNGLLFVIFWFLPSLLKPVANYLFFYVATGALIFAIQMLIAIKLGRRITHKLLLQRKQRLRLKNLKAKLNHSQKRSRYIQEHIIEGIIILDTESRIIFANTAAQNLFSVNKIHRGMSLAALVREPEVHELIAEAIQQKKDLASNVFIFRENKNLWIKVSVLPSQEILLAMIDTTLAHSVDEKHNDFIAQASHELKTPISVILANSELLSDSSSIDARDRGLLLAIMRQALRAKNLLESLLDLLRLDASVRETAAEPINLRDFITNIKQSVGHYGVTINNDLASDITIYANQSLLERLVLIIVDNAQKYAGPAANLCITAITSDTKIKWQFSDDGPGIKPHFRERVFERFFRQPEHDQSDHDGFGLGLCEARAIAKTINAQIFIDDKPPPGCTINILFPYPPHRNSPA